MTPEVAQPATEPPAAPSPAASTDADTVPIESLLYEGPRALQRALELQPAFERIAGNNPEALDKVTELFDLIRLGSA
jgi:hypothetical protein